MVQAPPGAAIAHALGSGQVELIAQGVQQSDSGLKLRIQLFAVHREGDGYLAGPVLSNLIHRAPESWHG